MLQRGSGKPCVLASFWTPLARNSCLWRVFQKQAMASAIAFFTRMQIRSPADYPKQVSEQAREETPVKFCELELSSQIWKCHFLPSPLPSTHSPPLLTPYAQPSIMTVQAATSTHSSLAPARTPPGENSITTRETRYSI